MVPNYSFESGPEVTGWSSIEGIQKTHIMPTYYVTFGHKYRYETHPQLSDAHPDGYVVIEAADFESARQLAFENLGPFWSNIYDENEFEKDLYPQGAIAYFSSSEKNE